MIFFCPVQISEKTALGQEVSNLVWFSLPLFFCKKRLDAWNHQQPIAKYQKALISINKKKKQSLQ